MAKRIVSAGQPCGIGDRTRTHGMSRSPEYNNWVAMKSRCTNPNNQDYALYGGRGIQVCERWLHSFENFLADMGHRPRPRSTVERIDLNGHYCPENCRWASQREQTRNKSNNHRIEFRGESLTIAEWSERLGLPQRMIQDRIVRYGWSVEDALTTPALQHHQWSRLKTRRQLRNS